MRNSRFKSTPHCSHHSGNGGPFTNCACRPPFSTSVFIKLPGMQGTPLEEEACRRELRVWPGWICPLGGEANTNGYRCVLNTEGRDRFTAWVVVFYTPGTVYKRELHRKSLSRLLPHLVGARTSDCSDLPGKIGFSQFLFFLLPVPFHVQLIL